MTFRSRRALIPSIRNNNKRFLSRENLPLRLYPVFYRETSMLGFSQSSPVIVSFRQPMKIHPLCFDSFFPLFLSLFLVFFFSRIILSLLGDNSPRLTNRNDPGKLLYFVDVLSSKKGSARWRVSMGDEKKCERSVHWIRGWEFLRWSNRYYWSGMFSEEFFFFLLVFNVQWSQKVSRYTNGFIIVFRFFGSIVQTALWFVTEKVEIQFIIFPNEIIKN